MIQFDLPNTHAISPFDVAQLKGRQVPPPSVTDRAYRVALALGEGWAKAIHAVGGAEFDWAVACAVRECVNVLLQSSEVLRQVGNKNLADFDLPLFIGSLDMHPRDCAIRFGHRLDGWDCEVDKTWVLLSFGNGVFARFSESGYVAVGAHEELEPWHGEIRRVAEVLQGWCRTPELQTLLGNGGES